MTKLVLCSVAVALFGVRAAAQIDSASGREIPARLLIPISRYDIRGEVAPLEESKALNEPLGLPRLRTTALPAGVREIRIYEGLVIGYPHSGLVVREQNGKVSGFLFRYWPRNDTSFAEIGDAEARYEQDEAHRCNPPVRGKEATICKVRFTTEPNWSALLQALDKLHAWDLPDESRVRKSAMVFDGWVIRAEARRDTSYVRYQYHNPEVYEPPYGPSALAIMRLVDSLFRYTPPPPNLKYVHGILLYGRDTSDFSLCGKNEVGLMDGMIYPIAKVIGDSAYKSHIGPTAAFEIEGWARHGTEPKERYKRKFNSTWYLDSMTVVKPAVAHSCKT
ncbi:MAG TPA: hypothetical protein VJS39_05300 [Gemmatimonadaceae bacterium]|nr:hypothetical protein [Gemmatimonadaceae bacterium]